MESRRAAPRSPVSKVLLYLLLAVIAFMSLLPFLYMIANSLKTLGETITRVSADPFSPQFWPTRPEWVNFIQVLRDQNMAHYFVNSVVISCTTVAGLIVTTSLAAYAFSKLAFVGKQVIFSILIATLMVPETVLLIPNFLIVAKLGWINRLPALTVPFMAGAFYIFLLRQFFNQVPSSLIESAKLEGAGNLRTLMRIVLPLSSAPLFTVAFLAFSDSWNGLQWALVVTNTDRWRPITVGLARYISEAGPQTQLRMAGAIVALLPTVAVFIAAQRRITEAIARTGMKA